MTVKEILEKAINKYGWQHQVDVAIEEMAELIQALLHDRRHRPSNIAEEIADVEIMCLQLEMIFECREEVKFYVNKKLERLKERLAENEKL